MNISIIVPIYHGKKYIRNLISQAEANAKNMLYEVELLLVNDAPEDPVDEEFGSEYIRIQVINTDKNRGIHGARVRGLERAKGDFILFLDQDDRIASDYMKKQLAAIGNADAIVCKVFQDGKEFYYQGQMLQECVTRYYMLQKGNFIISPGQVLLRKESIPVFWRDNILAANGADDWFLWICMLCAKRKFACNQEVLFEHIVHANNTSANGMFMLNSMHEMYEKLKRYQYCTEQDLHGINQIIQNHNNNYLKERDKFLELYFMLDSWMEIRERGKSVADYIRENGYDEVSIYGKGRIGLRLASELRSKRIEVNCFIDQNARTLTGGIRTILPEEISGILEPVIITLAKNETAVIKQLLREKGVLQVYVLADIVEYLINVN